MQPPLDRVKAAALSDMASSWFGKSRELLLRDVVVKSLFRATLVAKLGRYASCFRCVVLNGLAEIPI